MIVNRLREYRKRRNLSQTKLAEMSRVDVSSIYGMERGVNNNPTLETMLRLCSALNALPQDVFFPDFTLEIRVSPNGKWTDEL